MKQLDGREIYTISEVNYSAKQTLEQLIFWVEGEISSCRINPNWNFYYLDLKDENAVLPCIAEGRLLADLGDEPVGQKVLAYGNLSLYEPWGKYQFRIARIEKFGEGFLQKQLEELIKKLKAEGLFDAKHKKEIPKYPKRVCLVTSQDSAAWNDFKRHTVDKFPIIELYTADVRVQGANAVPGILKILPQADKGNYDVIVITRGGGSIEDLAAFNDERVARAIFALKTPTIVAIGHEHNESLAEWVADMRASTPTHAAHIVTASYQNLLSALENIKSQLKAKTTYYFSTNLQKLDYIHLQLQYTKSFFKNLPDKLSFLRESLKRHEARLILDAAVKADNNQLLLIKNFRHNVDSGKQQLEQLEKQLKKEPLDLIGIYTVQLGNLEKSLRLLSPENTLSRGYSITTNSEGKVIRSVKNVVIGETIGVKLIDGKIISEVSAKE